MKKSRQLKQSTDNERVRKAHSLLRYATKDKPLGSLQFKKQVNVVDSYDEFNKQFPMYRQWVDKVHRRMLSNNK